MYDRHKRSSIQAQKELSEFLRLQGNLGDHGREKIMEGRLELALLCEKLFPEPENSLPNGDSLQENSTQEG
jgi:hypothetical protein